MHPQKYTIIHMVVSACKYIVIQAWASAVPYPSYGKCKGEMCFNYNIFICQKITKIVAIRYVSQAHIPKQSWRTVL